MRFDTDGVYTLVYTAEDDCGNTATEERTVNVISYNTVLYTDGTFIINEKSTDRDANVALHGAVTNEYIPFDPNGATNREKYIFTSSSDRPWHNQWASIKSVEIGTPISPTSTADWFAFFEGCTNIDLNNLDTSNVVDMDGMFNGCSVLASLDLQKFDTSNVIKMDSMFRDCKALTELDVSSFHTSNVTAMDNMFRGCEALTTIFVSNDFVVAQVTSSLDMFSEMSTNLVGGSGTRWNQYNQSNKLFARIDNPPTARGYFTEKTA